MKMKSFLNNLTQYRIYKRNISYKKFVTWYSSLKEPKPTIPPHKHIIQIGDPRLRVQCKPVQYDEIETEKIQRLITHLKHVFVKYNCLGLSAVQIGVPLRIFIMGISKKSLKDFTTKEQNIKEVTLIEPTIVINPIVKITDYKKVSFAESCGSIRGFCADVPRYYSLQLTGYNEYAESIDINASGFTSRVIQHEMDHLDGKLYTDIMDKKTLSCSCWEIVNQRNGKVELPYGPF